MEKLMVDSVNDVGEINVTYTSDHQRARPTLGAPKGMLGLTRSHCYNIVYLPTSPPESSD